MPIDTKKLKINKYKVLLVKYKNKLTRFVTEIKDFVVVFTIVFWFGWLFVNAQLVLIMIDNITWDDVVSANEITLVDPSHTEEKISLNKEKTNLKKNITQWDDLELLKRELLNKKLNSKLKKLHSNYKTDAIYKPNYNTDLKNKLSTYTIKFDKLPPDPRIIIPKIWVNVHIVTLTSVPLEKIKKADYDSYLYDGVVQYPYTPEPWRKWNVFIFGHTSYYWWKHNPYWTVFSKIPRLRHGDIMQLNWGGKIYKYSVFKKLILWPNQVDDVYKKYHNGEYLTIMWCYPIWSDRQRMVILARRIN